MVKTMGGEWTTNTYDPVMSGGKEIGVNIDLKFMPAAPVDSKKIGLTQMVKSVNEGSLVAMNDTVKDRSIPAGEEGEGQHIDQLKQFKNPMYATGATGADDKKLGDTPTNASWGQHGHHYKNESGGIEKLEALLKDTPKLPGRGANATQIFETTALSLEGAQANTYYGSVQWGWKTDAAGKFEKLPLTIVSSGVPTPTFMKSAELWNKSKTEGGDDLMKLPTSAHQSHAECFTDEGLKQKIAELEAKAAKDPDPNIQFEILFLKQEQEERKKKAAEGK